MRYFKTIAALLLAGVVGHDTALARGKAARVVMVVWDGMRPDFVNETNTPSLWRLSQEGVNFLHHHPVSISTTEVNGTALATGQYPGVSGLIGNVEFRPAIDPARPVATEAVATIRRGDEAADGHYLDTATVAEILHDKGGRTVIAASKGVGLLHDRGERGPEALGATLFAGKALPESWNETLTRALGAFPPEGDSKIAIDQWTTKALTDILWSNGPPPFSVLWLAEPDNSQHRGAPGSPLALAAIKSSDDNLGRVLEYLDQHGLRDSTDVIVVSDHGFSTVFRSMDVAAALKDAGFRASRNFTNGVPQGGDLMVVDLSGATLIYVTGHDPEVAERVAHCLQAQAFTGVVATKKPVAGAFTLADLHIDSANAPDVVDILRWMPETNQYGAAGMIYCDLTKVKGNHGTLGRSDMHNTCFAAGPDFAKGLRDPLPSGNVDIAPTILWILGVEPARPMSGRVLSEALTVDGPPITTVRHDRKTAAWDGPGFQWKQDLEFSRVNNTEYFDFGGGSTNAPAAP